MDSKDLEYPVADRVTSNIVILNWSTKIAMSKFELNGATPVTIYVTERSDNCH